MKTAANFFILSIFLCIGMLSHKSYGQIFETVDQIELTTFSGKSYLVNSYGKLLPGFSVKASVNGTFYLKANPNPNGVSNASNFIRTETLLIATDIPSTLSSLSVNEKSTVYEYIDGLGRSTQTINVKGSPIQNDVVTFIMYDASGNKPKEYLSYTIPNGNGAPRNDAIHEQAAFYLTPPAGVVSDAEPFKINIYDNTPNNNVTEVYRAGADWHTGGGNKSIKSSTHLNQANEIIGFSYDGSGVPLNAGYYPANTLIVTETIDESSQITRSYKDFSGKILIARVGDGTTWHDTYNVYDYAGNLAYVFPPEAMANIADYYTFSAADKQAFLDRFAFQYQYDSEQRLILNRGPGSIEGNSGWTVTVYDQWNRIVLSQDPAQSTRNEYLFTKYDRNNRVILTGLYTTTTNLATLRTNVAASAVRFETETTDATGYTLTSSFPTNILEDNLLTVNYYDNYSFINTTGWDAEANSYTFVNLTGYPQSSSLLSSVKGYATGSKVRVGQSRWLNAVTYYDRKYHAIQVIKESPISGIIRSTNNFLFSGRLEKDQFYNSLSSLTTQNEYTYDPAGRTRTIKHSINGATPILMVSNAYNELGQLIEKNIHSTDNGVTFLQSIDNKFNIQGWKTQINNSALTPEAGDTNTDLFGMEFQYNPTTTSTINNSFNTKKFYNGNISSIRWKTDTKQSTPIEQIYGFDYDAFSKLKQGYYSTNNAGIWNGNGGMFDEQINDYDNNGNIKKLLRFGNVQGSKIKIDDLTLTYSLNSKNGNRLITADDASNNSLGFKAAVTNLTEEYQYDENGNVTFDFNKSISLITYNYLNLPTSIQFTRADGSVDKIEYVYDALGNKVKKTIWINGNPVWVTEYVGSMQYDNGRLSFFGTPEGRIVNNSGSYEYEYFHKDHQGNVRVAYGPLKETVSYRATMEIPTGSTLAADEEVMFQNVAATRSTPADPTFNYTPSSEKILVPNRSAQCNGYTSKAIGPAKSLRVLNGDAVYMETYAKYWNVSANNSNIITNLVSVVGSSFTIANPTEAATFAQQLSTNLPITSGNIERTATVPKAYLIWLFFDDSYIFQRAGAQAIGTNAYRAFEKLSRSFTADKDGHLLIYVANESKESAAINVYFDDLYIVHQKTTSTLQVTQASDYYPFGLSFNQYHADRLNQSDPGTYTPTLRNRYLFQGQELQKDLDLNWYQLDARMYDPAIGRFAAVDPLAEKFLGQSPYNYALNNPVLYVDPNGKAPYIPHYSVVWDINRWQSRTLDNYYNRIGQEVSGITAYRDRMYGPMVRDLENGLRGNGGGESYENTSQTYMNNFAQAIDTGFPFIGNLSKMMASTATGDMEGVAWNGFMLGINATAIPLAVDFGIAKLSPFLSRSTYNIEAVAAAKGVTALRTAYVNEVEGLSSIASKMRAGRSSSEEIARTLHGLRRELGVKYKSLTSDDVLQQIYQRNLQKYGDELGPTIDYLIQQGKSWDDIINSATRTGGKDLGF